MVFGRGFNSRRLHHFIIQGSPVQSISPLKNGLFLFHASMAVLTDPFENSIVTRSFRATAGTAAISQ